MRIKELLRLSVELIYDFVALFFKKKTVPTQRYRKAACTGTLYVGLHEWGGYKLTRSKKVNVIKPFECGLKYQIERFKKDYKGLKKIDLTITMSEPTLHEDLEYVKQNCDSFIETSNLGKDFAGYKAFYDSIKNKSNAYVLLTNTSVSSYKCDFIDCYTNYMENNKDVGILGISYNSKCRVSFVKNNFTPHLQSFFLLTTIEVLNQIFEKNNNEFPGANIELKQLLIRDGEIKISQLALQLGYKLAVVTDNGVCKFTNDINDWNLKYDDCRLGSDTPNNIVPLVC